MDSKHFIGNGNCYPIAKNMPNEWAGLKDLGNPQDSLLPSFIPGILVEFLLLFRQTVFIRALLCSLALRD